ncbi:MAG: hypothetical protein Q9159_003880 [Coniocarpon cinnabarinum]
MITNCAEGQRHAMNSDPYRLSQRAVTLPVVSSRDGQNSTVPDGLQSFADLRMTNDSTANDVNGVRPTNPMHSLTGDQATQHVNTAMNTKSEASRALVARAAPKIEDGKRLAKLNQYDTIFVIDDTSSMALPANERESQRPETNGQGFADHWSVLENCLEGIVDVATAYDQDGGIDVRFLKTGKDTFRDGQTFDQDHLTNGQDLLDRLMLIRSMLGTQRCEGGTFFWELLYDLMFERSDKWQKFRKQRDSGEVGPKPKFVNIIVITDGAADDPDEIEWAISEVAKSLDASGAPPRCVGVQFVQIGDDKDARDWLKKLDDELGRGDVRFREMIDTKPWDPSNIEGMLLGAIVPTEDNQRAAAGSP